MADFVRDGMRLYLPDLAMQTRQSGLEGTCEITARRLVVEALRMRPHRLVVREAGGLRHSVT